MTRRWVAIGVLIGLLAGFHLSGPSPAAAGPTSAVRQVACGAADRAPDLVPEVRSAAATAAAMQLNRELIELLPEELQRDRRSFSRGAAVLMRAVPFDRTTLEALATDLDAFVDRAEAIARGPNRECRSVATGRSPAIDEATLALTLDQRSDVNLQPLFSDFGFGALHDAYVLQAIVDAWRQAEALPPKGDLPTDELYQHVGEIAQRATEAETYSLAFARAMVPVSMGMHQFDRGSDRDFPNGLASDLLNFEAWRRVACGGTATFESLNATFDGEFAVDGFDRYRHPFRRSAAFAWFSARLIGFPEHRPDLTFEELRSLARHGCTPELRSYASFFVVPPAPFEDSGPDERAELVGLLNDSEHSAETKALARNRLALLLWDTDRAEAALQAQAVGADSFHLRRAASQALAMRWAERVLNDEIGMDTTLSIQGPAGETVASGTLTQIAYQTTRSDPVLARAPIDALALLQLKNAGGLAF